MSNISLIIEERAASIGNFLVGRLLPFRQKRMVGPFAFIDHMGPISVKDHDNLDVDPHPHIGLSTLTYLFEGELEHKDSIGTIKRITPGAVNFMTAGSGVVHSERIPQGYRESNPNGVLHGLQIWIALPVELEKTPASFVHVNKEDLPSWVEDQVEYTLVAGKALGRESSVPVSSPLYFIEIKSPQAKTINIGDGLYGESALYILQGSVITEGQEFGPKQILIAKDATLCSFEVTAGSIVYIFGGEPLKEQRHLLWNFVASDTKDLQQAKQAWIDQDYEQFPLIPSDNQTYVPFPEPKEGFREKK